MINKTANRGAKVRLLAIALGLSASLIAGCGGGRVNLQPGPGAQTLPGEDDAAVAEVAGVRMVVETDAWSGNPANLEDVITPLRVTVENHSNQPLRIRYNEFTLAGLEGFSYAALPPYRIEGSVATVSGPLLTPRFTHFGYYVAPYYHPYFRGLRPWGYPWAFDGGYYDRYYRVWRTPLPTEDMIEMGIPEGVLEPRGRVEGFLYFQRINEDLSRVEFRADLMNAQTGASFGKIAIPFLVD